MSIKRILLPINGRDNIMPVAKFAFDVAGKLGAQVEVLHPYTPYYDFIVSVGEGGSALQVAQDLENAKNRFEQENVNAKQVYTDLQSANAGIKSNYVDRGGAINEIVTQRSFSSDMVVLGSPATFDTQFWRDVYDGAMISSTKPVLIAPTSLPQSEEDTGFATELLIAWGGTGESARALAAAKPFFATCDHVKVLTITSDEHKIETAGQIKEYIELHGAKSDLTVVEPSSRNIAETLLSEASAKPGTLLVMGAYSHARWQERLFGGVTEHILHNTSVPVLMAH